MYLLRKVQDNDVNLLKGWLQQDYVAEWFGNVEDWLLKIKGRDGEYNFIQHFIVEDNQIPIGFVQYYDYNKIPLEDVETQQPSGTYGIDYMLGKRELLGQGIGKILVKLICDKVIEDHPEVTRLAADPTIEETRKNEASIRVLEINGFRFDESSEFYIRDVY